MYRWIIKYACYLKAPPLQPLRLLWPLLAAEAAGCEGGISTQALLGQFLGHTCRIPSVSSPIAARSHITAAMS